jgi:hypothetical protein
MPDPIDELEGFTMPTVHPLPPGEVRRRGDRIRRRNRALATVGGMAVVAAIAAPLAAVASHQGSSGPEPADPGPSVAWVRTIPADFPLTDGLPTTTKTRDGYQPQAVDVCESEAWATGDATDVRQATYSDGIEGGDDRVLALFPTQADAESSVDALDAGVRACADRTGGATRSAEVVPSDVGDQSLAWANQMGDGQMFVFQAVRVGNAVLLDSAFAMGGGDTQVVRQTVDLLQRRSADVLASMCVFSAEPCDAPPATGEGAVSSIPPDFALDRGLTSPGGDPLIGPSATADGVPPVELCGSTTWPVPGVERLAVTATGPTYLETRELVTFSSTADVTAALDGLRAAARDCADSTPQDVAPAGADDSVTFTVPLAGGDGHGIYQFAQVGRAVYATYHSGDWTGAALPAAVADLTAATEKLLPQLCIWTEQGC